MPKIGISGKIDSWEVVNRDGSIANACYESHKNTILDYGLTTLFPVFHAYHSYGQGYCPIQYCAIGTGTPVSPVPTTDEYLDAEVARGRCCSTIALGGESWSHDAYFGTTVSAIGSDPYYIAGSIGIQTPYGLLNGTYGEIGFSPYGANQKLFSKYRILDELGNPTTVPVTSEQQLRIKYTITFQLTPATPTHAFCYMKGISAEPLVEDFGYTYCWQYLENSAETLWKNFAQGGGEFGLNVSAWDYTFRPIGTSLMYSEMSNQYNHEFVGYTPSFTAGNKYVDYTFVFGVTQANFTIRMIGTTYYNGVFWVAKFDVPIVKPNTHRLTIVLRDSWDRV